MMALTELVMKVISKGGDNEAKKRIFDSRPFSTFHSYGIIHKKSATIFLSQDRFKILKRVHQNENSLLKKPPLIPQIKIATAPAPESVAPASDSPSDDNRTDSNSPLSSPG